MTSCGRQYTTSSRIFPRYLAQAEDPRQKGKIVYSLPAMLATGLGLFLTGSGSRNHYRMTLDTAEPGLLAGNLRFLCGEHLFELPTTRAVDDLLLALPHTEVAAIVPEIMNRLLRTRALERFRLFDHYYTIAVDGTGYTSSSQRHCPSCLHQTQDGITSWYHQIS